MAAQLRRFVGTVIKWRSQFGWGFVRPDGASRDVFLALGEFEEKTGSDEIHRGSRVAFYIEQLPKGLSAIRIVKV
jgi:cold shock CspA family protein